MSTIGRVIRVYVPVSIAYHQWTRFEEFPRFMEGVTLVRRLDDHRLHWLADVAGQTRQWDADIVEQTPNRRIAWRGRTGAPHACTVTFEAIGDVVTEVMLQIEYEADGLFATVDHLSFMIRRVEGDLDRFKWLIEYERRNERMRRELRE